MVITAVRAEIDETIEVLARLPSYRRHSREALAAVSDTINDNCIKDNCGTWRPVASG